MGVPLFLVFGPVAIHYKVNKSALVWVSKYEVRPAAVIPYPVASGVAGGVNHHFGHIFSSFFIFLIIIQSEISNME
jgi:hypothetical protein